MTNEDFQNCSLTQRDHIQHTANTSKPLDCYEVCPKCGTINAYDWNDVDHELEISHISCCSGLGEWQCGNCQTYWIDRDSPLNHPCYTHSEE